MKRFSIPPGLSIASIWVVWLFLVIGVLGWAIYVVLSYMGITLKVENFEKEAAAWIQAIGSVGAIVGAIFIAQYTHRLERKMLAEESLRNEVDALRFAENAVYEAYSAVNKVAAVASGSPSKIGLERLEEVRYTLRNLLQRQLPAEVFGLVFTVQEQVSECQSVAARVMDKSKGWAGWQSGEIAELRHRATQLSKCREAVANFYHAKATSAGIEYSLRPEDEI